MPSLIKKIIPSWLVLYLWNRGVVQNDECRRMPWWAPGGWTRNGAVTQPCRTHNACRTHCCLGPSQRPTLLANLYTDAFTAFLWIRLDPLDDSLRLWANFVLFSSPFQNFCTWFEYCTSKLLYIFTERYGDSPNRNPHWSECHLPILSINDLFWIELNWIESSSCTVCAHKATVWSTLASHMYNKTWERQSTFRDTGRSKWNVTRIVLPKNSRDRQNGSPWHNLAKLV